MASPLLWSILAMMIYPTLYITLNNKTILVEWTLLSLSASPVSMTLIADPTGMLFSCTVLMISANVLMFSTQYMKEDKFIDRFTILVLLFVASMNMLIFLPHLIMLLLGWDGLGLVSFLLVIYYQNPKSLGAGMITALTNRIGDVMLLISIAWTLNQGHWNIMHMWQHSESIMMAVAIMLAAMTKSAQMPFSSWLPAAMAAPTPVSALVHSSTLVTAGVFLLIRFFPFLSSMWWFTNALLFVAVMTTTMAGLSAMTECDMKKIIALSTLSQLGMMMAAMGLGMLNLALFHMITHALFKALLFICAGTLIHGHMHSQDLRWMGNITNQMPVASSCFLLANSALCGIPFMSGFYSKDMIIESSMFYAQNMFMLMVIVFTVSLTAFYSTRFSMFTVWGPSNSATFLSLEETAPLSAPMLIMAFMSVVSGSMMMWMLPYYQEPMNISLMMKMMALSMVVTGLITAWLSSTININSKSISLSSPMTHFASCLMWFLVPLSSQFTMKMPMMAGHNYLKSVDQSWLELMGGQGIKSTSFNSSNTMMAAFNAPPMNMLLMSMMTGVTILSIS